MEQPVLNKKKGEQSQLFSLDHQMKFFRAYDVYHIKMYCLEYITEQIPTCGFYLGFSYKVQYQGFGIYISIYIFSVYFSQKAQGTT